MRAAVATRRERESMTPDDRVVGVALVSAIDELTIQLMPVLIGTRQHGDKGGVEFISGLLADLSVLRESVRSLVNEME